MTEHCEYILSFIGLARIGPKELFRNLCAQQTRYQCDTENVGMGRIIRGYVNESDEIWMRALQNFVKRI